MADEAFLGAPEGGVETLSRQVGAAPWSERGGGAMAEFDMHVVGGGATGGAHGNPKAW
jgi:hypothetical protein